MEKFAHNLRFWKDINTNLKFSSYLCLLGFIPGFLDAFNNIILRNRVPLYNFFCYAIPFLDVMSVIWRLHA